MVLIRFTPALAAMAFLLVAGCRDRQIATYRVPKESTPAMPPLPADPMAAAAAPGVRWQKPEGWQELPSTSIRLGNFLAAGTNGQKAEITVTSFPGDVGGDLANVNRWRGQLQLPPITEAELAPSVTHLDLPAGHFDLVELVSAAPLAGAKGKARSTTAWLKQPDRTWFFKLAGDEEVVLAQRDAFLAFLRTVEFGASPAPAAPVATNPAPAAPLASLNRTLAWTAPASWTAKPLTQMRKGSFSVRGSDNAEADFSVISFPGQAGGLVENLNRWRNQIGLAPQSPTELASGASTVENGALQFTVVDFLGTTTTGPTRVVGAVLPFGDETYFFKLMGPDALVAQQKPAFLDFLKTVNAR